MTRFKAVKYGTKDDWVEGWFFPRFWMAGNGVEESIFIRDAKGSEFEIKPETIHQEIGGEWYELSQLEAMVALNKTNESYVDELQRQVDKLQDENAQLKTEVERLEADKTYKSAMISELQAEVERLRGNASSCDDILQELEDYTHGALGDKITIARIKLKE